MKHAIKLVLCSILFFFVLSPVTDAYGRSYTSPAHEYGPQGRRFGLGIIAGDPTGLSAKGYVTPKFAIDGIVAWSFVDGGFMMIGDLTYEFFDFSTGMSDFSVPFYVGAGAKVGFDRRGKNSGRTIVGVRVPVGVAMQFVKYPIEVFFEVAPGIELAPSTEFDITGGIGVRWYFF